MSKSRVLLFLSIVLSIPSAPSFSQEEVPESRTNVERDSAGNIIKSDDGAQHVFSRDELEASAPPSHPLAPLDGEISAPLFAQPDEGPYTLGLDNIWNFAIWGTSIGRTGMIPVDLDDDESLEIIVGASLSGGFAPNSHWHVLRYDDATGDYQTVFTSPNDDNGVSRVVVLEIGGQKKIYVGNGIGELKVFDATTLGLLTNPRVANDDINSILLADADNDGDEELVVSTLYTTHLLDPESLVEESQIAHGDYETAVGNVDTDPALELVFVSGKVIEYDGVTATEEWDYSSFGGGRYLGLSDLDEDGMLEIVSARGWYYIDIFDADTQSPKGQILSDLDIQALLLADVTGDGKDEILYGDGQWGNVYAHDATTLEELWRIRNPEHGTTRMAVADTDGDGDQEVMWGAGWTSTGPDYFYVHDIATLANEFESEDLVGPFNAVAMGDSDDDGVDEIVAVSFESESGYADGVVHVFDSETFALEWRSDTNIFNRFAWTGVHDVTIGDVDGDGTSEIVVGTDRLYNGAIYIIDGRTHALERQFLFDDGSPIKALDLADYDDDGVLDIVAGSGRAHTGSPGTYAYVIDGVTGAVKWQSVSLGTTWQGVYSLEAHNLNPDTIPDIIMSYGGLFAIDGATKIIKRTVESDYLGFALTMGSGGQNIIWAGTSGGELVTVDPDTLERTVVATVCTGPVNSVKSGVASTLSGSVQFACDDDIGIWDIFGEAVIWRSDDLGSNVGYANNLLVTDRDEKAELIAGTRIGVTAFGGYGTSNTDIDEDGVLNHLDNCPETPNPDQADADGDGVGDACNDEFDADGDEWADNLDNCPVVENAGQQDSDSNGVGNACNSSEDEDGDEWADDLDNCLGVANSDQADGDGDLIGDVCDPYPNNPDNYAARCEEAIINEAELGVELQACQAIPKLVDSDGDGEADQTDQCSDTLPGSQVDAAGCSQRQFCGQYSGNKGAFRTCIMSDWKNDEPDSVAPFDCRARMTGGSWFDPTITCRPVNR